MNRKIISKNEIEIGSIIFSLVFSFSISFTIYNYISKGLIFSKRIALLTFILFVIIFIGAILINPLSIIKRFFNSTKVIMTTLIVLIVVIQFGGMIRIPNAYYLLPDQKVNFLLNYETPSQLSGKCEVDILSMHNGFQWLYGNSMNLIPTEIENNKLEVGVQCPKREIEWEGKIYKELEIVLQQQPGGGNLKIRHDGKAYSIDLMSPEFQEYHVRIPSRQNIFQMFYVEQLPNLFLYLSLTLIFFVVIGIIEKYLEKLTKGKIIIKHTSINVLDTFFYLLVIAAILVDLIFEVNYLRIAIYAITLLIYIGVRYLFNEKSKYFDHIVSINEKLSNLDITHIINIIFIVLVILVLFRSNPYHHRKLTNDEGVFLYIGREWLRGNILYRDTWDHKPPMIFLFNMFGLIIGKGSRWGIFILEIISLALATFLCFQTLKKLFGKKIAFWSTTLFLVSLPNLLPWGNVIEEFALPLQFLLIWLYGRMSSFNKRAILFAFFAGVASGILFLLRQNIIGTFASIVFSILLTNINKTRMKDLIKIGFLLILGFLSVQFISILYFAYHDVLYEYWRIAFQFNFAYSSRTYGGLITSIIEGWRLINNPLLLVVFLLGYVWLILKIGRKIQSQRENNNRMLSALESYEVLALILIPIEFGLTSMSGRNFSHYFITWLPSIILIYGFFLYWINSLREENVNSRDNTIHTKTLKKNAKIISGLLSILILFPASIELINELAHFKVQPEPEIIRYIQENTSHEDWVLSWGTHSLIRILYLSERVTPTRYTFQTSFVYPDYRTDDDIAQFCEEISIHKPKIIIDDNDFSIQHEIDDDPYFSCFTNFVQENYQHLGKFEDKVLNPLYGLDLYRLIE